MSFDGARKNESMNGFSFLSCLLFRLKCTVDFEFFERLSHDAAYDVSDSLPCDSLCGLPSHVGE